MKLARFLLLPVLALLLLSLHAVSAAAQTNSKTYQQMSSVERGAFVREHSMRIARELSGRDYLFTAEFVATLQKSVDAYAARVGNNVPERLGKTDLRLVLERGRGNAPVLSATFVARNVSPLIGIYLPLIESEFMNLQSPNAMGAVGMFQFLPSTGKRYGLSKQELLDIEKSADAAARYITDAMSQFKDDPMREALALLAYNRGSQKVAEDLALLLTKENESCSICALTAASSRLDHTFQDENVYYVPRFFAAAIIGENPTAFGLQMEPLSSYR